MREIEFRIWDKKYHMLEYDDSPDLLIGMDGKVYQKEERNYAGTSFIEYEVANHYEIMQYTGLKDKNGKEIYEGDILKEPAMYETPKNTTPTYNYFEVTYDNCSFQSGGIPMIEDIDWISEESEVVGNIYETPELLEESK
ncbi:YopX family protein [Bacillus mycoides]|uniref:YopX family protein n=1 Tax=Bacillus mycoides TaxID=1405 RepID=UPI002112F717|nr:YopX family protein [Bacillus mycoides]MCQ6529859.1 YopX family protein [Bacillus mycoides]